MFKQTITGLSLFLTTLLLIPTHSYSERGVHSNYEVSSHHNISDLSTDDLYQLYVENVEMNNPYLHQINHLGYKNELGNTGMYLTEFNLTDLEILERAQEESYRLFQIWLSDENSQKEFIAKMNDCTSKHSNLLASKNFK